MRLLRCFAVGLGFPEDFFVKEHDTARGSDCMTAFRILHYPDCTGATHPDNYWRAGAHTDFDILTLLFQRPGQGGLEMVGGRDSSTEFAWGDKWIPVHPVEVRLSTRN